VKDSKAGREDQALFIYVGIDVHRAGRLVCELDRPLLVAAARDDRHAIPRLDVKLGVVFADFFSARR